MSAQSELGFPVKGSLKRTPFPSLVKQISDASADGSLYLLSGKTKKVVFFEQGQPVFVRSNVLSECLGQILAREGLITDEQCEQTLEAIRRTGKKQGELLVEMGILSEGNLRYGLEAQLRHKLYDIFGWQEGRYQFKSGGPKQEFGMRVDSGVEGIIVSAILDTHSEDRAREALSRESNRYPLANGAAGAAELELMPAEQHFWACLDGSRSIDEVLDDETVSTATPAALLYALVQAGMVRLDGEAGAANERPDAPADPNAERPDSDFFPDYDPSNVIKSYEDTPLPGALPERPDDLPDEDEEMFGGLAANLSEVTTGGEREVSEDLLAAEADEVVDETFDEDDIELIDDDELEIVEDELLEEDEGEPEAAYEEEQEEIAEAAQDDDEDLGGDDLDDLADDDDLDDIDLGGDLEVDDDLALDDDDGELADDSGEELEEAEELEADDDLMDLDDLDDIDLGGESEDANLEEVEHQTKPTVADDAEDPEVVGAMRFSEGEMALQSGEFERAVELLEDAYENGVDVAELHAMLAYGRFKTAESDPEMQTHALELLDYAAELNANLDIIHAYRGAILLARGDHDGARAAFQQALDVNPYCDLAMELMDHVSQS